MKPRPIRPTVPGHEPDVPPPQRAVVEDGIDMGLLEDSLSKTVWERMLANDDAARLADLLHDAVLKTSAKPQRTDTQTR